jgi:hypothetical protein
VDRSNDADHWRKQAETARATAQGMTLPAARREMRYIAEAYERMANHAERTVGRKVERSRG